jgi:hypothetical protein
MAKVATMRGRGGGGGGPDGGRDIEAGARNNRESPLLPSATALVRTRVEPKTFFAAERTFIAWINISVGGFGSLALLTCHTYLSHT